MTIAASVKSVDVRGRRLVWIYLTMVTLLTDPEPRLVAGHALCVCARTGVSLSVCARPRTQTSTRNARDMARCALSVDNQATLQRKRQNRWLRTWWFQRWIHVMCCAATLPRSLTLRHSPTGWQTNTDTQDILFLFFLRLKRMLILLRQYKSTTCFHFLPRPPAATEGYVHHQISLLSSAFSLKMWYS